MPVSQVLPTFAPGGMNVTTFNTDFGILKLAGAILRQSITTAACLFLLSICVALLQKQSASFVDFGQRSEVL